MALVGARTRAIDQQRGAPPPTVGTAFLAGQIVDATTTQPITGVTVTLIGGATGRAGGPPAIVDSRGRFFFANLPAGRYQTSAVKPGYTATTTGSGIFPRRFDLADGERLTTLTLRLVKLGSLSGAVRDDGGDAAVGVDVVAFERAVVNGRSTIRKYTQAKTDDRGAYRLTGLRPGNYFVCACGQDPQPFDGLLLTTLAADPILLMGAAARALNVGSDVVTLDSTLRTLAPTFHPSSPTVARAARVTVAAGEDKTGIDIDAVLVRAARVSGTIIGAPNPVVAQSVRLTPAGDGSDGTAVSQLSPVLVQADGRFDFAGVPPGQYVLRVRHTVTAARGGGPSGSALQLIGARGATMGALNNGALAADEPVLWATQTISVGEDGLTGLMIPLRRGAPVSGRVEFDGAGPPPPPPQPGRAQIVLDSANGQEELSPANFGRVNADRTFRVAGVAPGRYVLIANPWPGWPTLKSVVIGGTDMTDLPIEVGETDISDVVVTFSAVPAATIAGTLAGAVPPSRDVSVVVFPVDRKYWESPNAAVRRFRIAPVNAKGFFEMAGLAAGDYFCAVIADESTSDWLAGSRLEQLSQSGERITLNDGQKATITVR